MEVVVVTDYQDIYRIDYGILLIINKYEYDYSYGESCWLHSAKDKPYHKSTQGLRILKEDTEHKGYNSETKTIPKGKVLRHGFPVKITDKTNWRYGLKTTGDSFSGKSEDILKYLNEIKELIKNSNS